MYTGVKVFVLLCVICSINCYYNFNPCSIFENMMSFTPILNEELEQLVLLNSRIKRSKKRVFYTS